MQYADENGFIRKLGSIDRAGFGDEHEIRNDFYRPIAARLAEKFEELSHIAPGSILWLQNVSWEPPKSGHAWQWVARCKKAPPMLKSAWGYSFIIEVRDWFFVRMSREQAVALIYHEMRHIGEDGEILHHDLEDWSNLVATFGQAWADRDHVVADLLAEDFEGFKFRSRRQISFLEGASAAMGVNGNE